MQFPKITVVVPSFNQAKFLGLTLASIVDQKYPNLELIVMDGGSTDESVNIIKKFESDITYWQSEKDDGQTAALSDGFKRSTGDIQCWLNSDDLYFSYTLHEVAEYFNKHLSVDAVFGNTIWIDENGLELRKHKEIGFNRFLWTYTYNYIPGMSMFWRRAVYEKAGGLDPSFNLAMDADLWIKMSYVGKISHIQRFWSQMRFYPEQKNVRLRDMSNKEDLRLRSRYWKNGKPRFYTLKCIIAKFLRVALKTVSGCYGFGYKRDLNDITESKNFGEGK